jgi:hypothetical protein
MADLPARRIDDRELRAELAAAAKIVGDPPGVLSRPAQPRRKVFHRRQSSE